MRAFWPLATPRSGPDRMSLGRDHRDRTSEWCQRISCGNRRAQLAVTGHDGARDNTAVWTRRMTYGAGETVDNRTAAGASLPDKSEVRLDASRLAEKRSEGFCFWIAPAEFCRLPLTIAPAADWGPLSRAQALAQAKSDQIDKRRLAYGRLAEVGTTDDVPVLLAALWDEEELIRGMAEQAVWGIWMRTDDPAADPMFQTGIQLLIEEKPGAGTGGNLTR